MPASLGALVEAGAVPEQPDVAWIESMQTYNHEKTEKFMAGLG